MKTNYTEFKCDECEQTTICHEPIKFPYEIGWQYLHTFNIKSKFGDEIVVVNIRDKHFCSKLCEQTFITKVINYPTRLIP